jgi:hypothetical protein
MSQPKVMNRAALTKPLVAKLKHDEAVIGGIGNSNFDLWSAGTGRRISTCWAAWGSPCRSRSASPSRSRSGIVAIEGDGSILMSLGCLSTVARLKPRNLTIIIIDNGIYQITGKQPTTTQSVADIVAIARASGIENSAWINDEAHFDSLIDRALGDSGPTLLAAKIDDQPGVAQTPRDPALIRNRFMKGLGTNRAGALDQ